MIFPGQMSREDEKKFNELEMELAEAEVRKMNSQATFWSEMTICVRQISSVLAEALDETIKEKWKK